MEEIKNIRNMDNTGFVCIYDINNSTYRQVLDDTYKIKRDIGFYVKVNGKLVGVMASSKGPVFFNNRNLYYLRSYNYEFIHSNLVDGKGKAPVRLGNAE